MKQDGYDRKGRILLGWILSIYAAGVVYRLTGWLVVLAATALLGWGAWLFLIWRNLDTKEALLLSAMIALALSFPWLLDR